MVEKDFRQKLSVKNILIISPYFPPVNAADMQRVRMSLPYFADHGWIAEVVTVHERYIDISLDPLLLQSVPGDIKIHKIKALSKRWTSKLGLGSLALRSLWFYRQEVNRLLKEKSFDLIYFSTTQFPVCILGPYWKKKFGVPYVIDIQDPWHSDYYQNKPRAQRPPKHWFSYRLNKYLEPIALQHTDGLISVSPSYIRDLKEKYTAIKNIPSAVITFGAFELDLAVVQHNQHVFYPLLDPDLINVVYIGRGGADMHQSIIPLFEVFKKGLADQSNTLFARLKFYFIGTSYAAAGQGKPTILPLAQRYGIADHVVELTDRISYYHTLFTLQQADALFVPGSDDPRYTASKLYPYLLTRKPLLTIFHAESSAIPVLKEYGVQHVYSYDDIPEKKVLDFLKNLSKNPSQRQEYNLAALQKYAAKNMALQQILFFNQVLHASFQKNI
jgi:hypothetical protein